MKSSTKACHGLRFIYTGKLRLSQTQQGDVCFLMGLLRAADQFCISAWKSIRSFNVDVLNNKSHIQSNHIPIFHKKKMPLIYQASFIFLSLKFPHPNTKLRRKIQAGKKIHRGVDCVKQLCEKYLSLAVEEEALALNSFKILVLIGFFFFEKELVRIPNGWLKWKVGYFEPGMEWFENPFKEHKIEIWWKKNSNGKRWGKCGSFPKWSWTFQALQLVQYCHLSFGAKWRILKSPGQNGEKWPHSTGNVCTCTYMYIYIYIIFIMYINCIILIVYSLHGAFGIGFKGGKFSDVLLVGFGYRTQNCGPLDFWKDTDIFHSFWLFVWAQGIKQKDDLMVSQEAMDQDVRDSLQAFPTFVCLK